MQAPCARYCSIGCAASPSSATRPFDQSLTGSRSHSTHMRQVSIRSSRRSTLRTLSLKCATARPGRLGVPALDVAVGMEHGDQVVELAAAQRIVHEVRARPAHTIMSGRHRSSGTWSRGAPLDRRYGPRHARLAVADDLLAHARPHAVAADQRGPDRARPIAGVTVTPVVVLLEILDAAVGLQRDEVVALAGLRNRP